MSLPRTLVFDLTYSRAETINGKWIIRLDHFPFKVIDVLSLPQHENGPLELSVVYEPNNTPGEFRIYITQDTLLFSKDSVWLYSYAKGVFHTALESNDG